MPAILRRQLDAGYLKAIAIDPYSDKPLVYRKGDGDFVLYSFGSDFDDDGGKMGVDYRGRTKKWYTEDGDAVFWPVERQGGISNIE